MIFAGGLFAATQNFYLLLLAAVIGVISPSGNEVGPFLSIEQASLTQIVPDARRTGIFAWYSVVGSLATACGALAAGVLSGRLQAAGWSPMDSYRIVVLGYALIGLVLLAIFSQLTGVVEAPPSAEVSKAPFGLHRSQRVVFRLSALFALDAFAGGFMIQSLLVLWFQIRFGVQPELLGAIFFGANLLAAISALSAAWIARHIGLINTMVFTHLPSNILLMCVPFMPNLALATLVLLARFSISQMDVPTRQSYTMAVVAPDERSAAAGITGVARTVGASLSPAITGWFLANAAWMGWPFLISGGLKVVYDLALFFNFRGIKPPEEQIQDS
jgi:MFS family permease